MTTAEILAEMNAPYESVDDNTLRDWMNEIYLDIWTRLGCPNREQLEHMILVGIERMYGDG